VAWWAQFLRQCLELKLVEGVFWSANVHFAISKPHALETAKPIQQLPFVLPDSTKKGTLIEIFLIQHTIELPSNSRAHVLLVLPIEEASLLCKPRCFQSLKDSSAVFR